MLPFVTLKVKNAPGGRVTAHFNEACVMMSIMVYSKRFERKLAKITRDFFQKHPGIKLVVVTGSAGKTSAKIAIGTILAQQFRVRLREEEPATRTDALLQIMGLGWPQRGWFRGWRTLRSAKKLVKRPQHEVQVVVQEFSPRQLGDNAWLGEYLKPDVAVITAVTDGRLQLDHSVDAIAQEMLAAANVSRMALINRDDIEGRFANYLTNPHISTYGTSSVAEYNYQDDGFSITDGHTGTIHLPEHQPLVVNLRLVGEHNIRPAVAAAAVGQALGMDQSAVLRGLAALRPLPGRMNVLRGAEGSWLIDDSYSSTPLTALAALQSLYSIETPQRIAVLGTMNGLRGTFETAHAELGSHCSPELLDWVVTVGEKANTYLAPAARRRGCQVKECANAIEAGSFVRNKIKSGGIALFKGSSGGVWLEEAIKINLHSIADERQLVRQSPDWLRHKNNFFSKF